MRKKYDGMGENSAVILSSKISQGSVAMHLKCDGKFFDDFVRFHRNLQKKKFESRLTFD